MSDLTGEPLRPVKVLLRYIAVWGRKGCEALFDVSAQDFSTRLTRMCQIARIKSKLTPHSFCHGGATWAVKQGWTVTHTDAWEMEVQCLLPLHKPLLSWRINEVVLPLVYNDSPN